MLKEKLFEIKDYSCQNPAKTLVSCLVLLFVSFLVASQFFDVPVVARALFVMGGLLFIGPVRWAFLTASNEINDK
jgi:hypothetical protein